MSPVLAPPCTGTELLWEPLPNFRRLAGIGQVDFADCRGQRVGILVLAYNAASTLASTLHRIPPAVWSNVEEVAIFDDASQDGTYELAEDLFGTIPKLSVHRHRRNLGYGGNQKAGYRYFLDRGFDAVVLLHGDGQYAPEIVAQLYHPIVAEEADAVFGSRMFPDYGGPIGGGMPLYKFLGNRILSALENRALGMHLSEFHSGYRAYRLDALRHIDFTHMTDDFHFDTEIIIKLHHQRYSMVEVPIPTYYGGEICHVNGLKYAANVLRAVGRYRRTCRSARRYPEFQEFFPRYPLKRTRYSSHEYARQMVGPGEEVLDVGCGEGLLARELTEAGARVTGLDCVSPCGCAIRRFIQSDLDQDGLRRVEGKRFDRVLLLDVLEHLRQPERVLGDCKRVLRRSGAAVISLPNVANLAIRLALLFGNFEYRDRGILDRTHLRFFTRKTARRLVRESGYEVLEEKVTAIPLEFALGLAPQGWIHRILNRALGALTKMFPTVLGYQFVFLVRPSPVEGSCAD